MPFHIASRADAFSLYAADDVRRAAAILPLCHLRAFAAFAAVYAAVAA